MNASIVIPVFNEQDNICRMYEAIQPIVGDLGPDYEIIFVDDGSTDKTLTELQTLAHDDSHLKVVEFRRNYGQTAAMSAGIQHATGDVIVTMDGDLQNDPADIPMMLREIEAGYDLVHGWRKNRQDAWLHRKLPSRAANWLISRVTGFPVNDLGCTLKAVRREIAQELELFGDMHRFIPILAHQRGARCLEVVTNHRARQFGTSKYGMSRVVRVLLDLITVKYLCQYMVSPMRLFGSIGIGCAAVGLTSALATTLMKTLQGVDMTGNPLLLLGVFSLMVGVQFFVLGLLGELGARIYFEVQNKRPYAVRSLKNFENVEVGPTIRVNRAA
ncbi:MAG: glycosyltransferase family 2 protein [Planctomycetaceae bacterium]